MPWVINIFSGTLRIEFIELYAERVYKYWKIRFVDKSILLSVFFRRFAMKDRC